MRALCDVIRPERRISLTLRLKALLARSVACVDTLYCKYCSLGIHLRCGRHRSAPPNHKLSRGIPTSPNSPLKLLYVMLHNRPS